MVLRPETVQLIFYDCTILICFQQKWPDRFSDLCFRLVSLTGKVGIYTARLCS